MHRIALALLVLTTALSAQRYTATIMPFFIGSPKPHRLRKSISP